MFFRTKKPIPKNQSQNQERDIYLSIVTGMSIFLPVGLFLGIIKGSLFIGIIAGNAVGLAIGITIVHLRHEFGKHRT